MLNRWILSCPRFPGKRFCGLAALGALTTFRCATRTALSILFSTLVKHVGSREERTRQLPRSNYSLGSLDTTPEHAIFFQQVKDFVHEAVARQLSLVTFTKNPTPHVPHLLRTLISENAAQVVPPAPQQPASTSNLTYAQVATPLAYGQPVLPVAAPLTYAQAMRKPLQPPSSTWPQTPPLPQNPPCCALSRTAR
ncbi:hypothetical protein HPB50_008185 [Hyalomma asiaticum]|uniref:Uncharacterized protein n=1 Tax=Hyalomma asiaticum TaxID=266040 RepID=A0ACB7SKL0_HYAAI|nr:hypothetical protein HPB50_008185 [Hyalomma asiaticum]